VHERGVYGERLEVAVKIWRQLLRDKILVAGFAVERLMRCLGLRSIVREKVVNTIFGALTVSRFLGRGNRRFEVDWPDPGGMRRMEAEC